MKSKVFKEFKEHIPFTALATLIAILITSLAVAFFKQKILNFSESIFDSLHILHLFFSAFVTSAIYYKYKNKILMALLVGVTGSIILGSISDIILPYFEANFLRIPTHFHLPIIEEPILILSSSIIGCLSGIKLAKTKISHLLHVFLSIFASLFYILAYSTTPTILTMILSFVIVFIAVIIPCCLSDIVYPLLFIKNNKH